MNKVFLIGRLTKEPELKFLPTTGTANVQCTIAVDRTRKKDGEKETDFVNIVIWGKQAENTANYSGKGKLISVCGRLQVRNYEGKDGIKRYITEVVCEEVQFLEFKGKNTLSAGSQNYEPEDEFTPVDGEIPF